MSVLPHPIIERLRVKNYRSLADVDIELNPLTILVGSNGSGKSNLVDVIRFVRDALTRGLDTAILDRGGMSAIRRWSPKGAPYDVTIQLYLRDREWSGEYSLTLGSERDGEYRVKRERVTVKEDQNAPVTLERIDNELIDFPEELIEQLLQRPSLPQHTSATTPLPSIMALFPSLSPYKVYRFLSSMGFYTIYPDNLREPQKPAHSYPLDEQGQNLASVLRDLKKKKNSGFSEIMSDALGKVVEGVHKYSVTRVGGYLVTRLHHHSPRGGRQGPAFELAQESDGTLRMLGILTALYQDPPRSLLAIEEPELTIHPGAMGVLCDIIQEASARSQVIITTHNPDLIDRFPANVLRVVEKEGDVTKIGQVSDDQREAITRKLFSPGELMRIEGLQRERSEAVRER